MHIIIFFSNIIFRPALNNSLELLNQTNKSDNWLLEVYFLIFSMMLNFALLQI